MKILRKSSERGYADHGWLKSHHNFSFAGYHDPRHMGVGNLRVINEDRIAPGTGFGTHSHRDMEIVSYVLEGELAHKDSMGNGEPGHANAGVIRPGDVQRMTAGTGVAHSEYNHAPDRSTHFLQIWLLPSKTGLSPNYEQKHFSDVAKRGRLCLIASPDGGQGSVLLNADAQIYSGLFSEGERAERVLAAERLGYAFLVRGRLEVNGLPLSSGDALTLDGEPSLQLENGRDAELLFFDLSRLS